MKLNKYWNFLDTLSINENVSQAKKLAKELYQVNKTILKLDPETYKTSDDGLILHDAEGYPIAPKDIDNDVISKAKELVRMDPAKVDKKMRVVYEEGELDKVEKTKSIEEIKQLVGKKQGYVYMFLYFKLVEQIPGEELADMVGQLNKNSDLLQRLRRNISNYIDSNVPNNFEQLADDIENIERYRKCKKFVNEFTSDTKKEYDESAPYLKDKLVDVAAAFDDLGKENGVVNKGKQKAIQKRFFAKIKAYPNLNQIITGAENFIKAESNENYSKFIETIYKTMKYGKDHASELLFDENGIIVFDLKSFSACKDLCGATSWCIMRWHSHWEDYVGGETVYNRQYVIVNFNISMSERESFIGATIKPGKVLRAAHYKNDNAVGGDRYGDDGKMSALKNVLFEMAREYDLPGGQSVLFDLLEPMSDEEVDRKKRRVSANRNIVKSEITLDELKQYHVEDGGDINAEKGKALDNAVDEDSLEKVEYLLGAGALTTLKDDEFDATINNVKSFDVLKLLLNHGAELTPHAFRPMLGNYDAVKFCLDNGMSPDLSNGMPLRRSVKEGYFDMVKLFVEHGAREGSEDGKVMKICLENDHIEMAEWLLANGFNKSLNKSIDWLGICRKKLVVDRRLSNILLTQKWIDEGLGTIDGDTFQVKLENDKFVNLTHEEIKEKYGSYAQCVIASKPDLKEEYEKLKSKGEK
jgi:hypothetical protein